MNHPAHISARDWERMPWHARQKAALATATRTRDTAAERETSKSKVCPDCNETKIRPSRQRCMDCYRKQLRANAKSKPVNVRFTWHPCADCTEMVGWRSTRCTSCSAKARRKASTKAVA